MANLIYRVTPALNGAGNNNKGIALTIGEVDGNFYGLQTDINLRAIKTGDTFSGNLLVVGTGQVTLSTSGDITAYRTGGTTGIIYLNVTQTRYLYNDGTQYVLPAQGLNVGGVVTATSFSGAGTGLTGTAAGLSVGGSASSVTAAGQAAITSVGTLVSLTVTGLITANGGVNVTGTVTSTSSISIAPASSGKIAMMPGAASNSGYLEFWSTSSSSRQGYIGYTTTTAAQDSGTIPYVAGLHTFIGAASFTGLLTASNGLTSTGGTTTLGVTTTTNLSASGTITISGENVMIQKTTVVISTSSTEIAALDTGTYRSVDFHIQAHDATTGKIQTSRILALHNGSSADYTEYGVVSVGGAAWSAISVVYSATVASLGGVPGIQLMVSPSSTNSTTFKVLAIATKV